MNPAEAVRKFGESLEAAVDGAARRLTPRDDPAVTIGWDTHVNGDVSIRVVCRSGRVIEGRGPAKLEAIAAAELSKVNPSASTPGESE